MNYGYIRVSTDKQAVENQRFEITRFCESRDLKIDSWIEETISGSKEPEKRKLGKLLARMEKGDILICAELSRLGRNLFMIMGILNQCMRQEIQVWTIKDNYRLGADISSKVLAFAFGLSAEIERNLISQRTKRSAGEKKSRGGDSWPPQGAKKQPHQINRKRGSDSQLFARRIFKVVYCQKNCMCTESHWGNLYPSNILNKQRTKILRVQNIEIEPFCSAEQH